MISHLDHLVLTTANLSACIHFYTDVIGIGMRLEIYWRNTAPRKISAEIRKSKGEEINIHEKGHEFEPKANCPQPGALDLCFISSVPLDFFIKHLAVKGTPIEEGPVMRTGSLGRIRSVYLRDPGQKSDRNFRICKRK